MIQENELITFLLYIAAMIFIFVNRKILFNRNNLPLLVASCCMFGAAIFTLVEGYWLPEIMNSLEHLSHTLAAFCIFIWILKQYRKYQKQ